MTAIAVNLAVICVCLSFLTTVQSSDSVLEDKITKLDDKVDKLSKYISFQIKEVEFIIVFVRYFTDHNYLVNFCGDNWCQNGYACSTANSCEHVSILGRIHTTAEYSIILATQGWGIYLIIHAIPCMPVYGIELR
jgi:hypothetical protein